VLRRFTPLAALVAVTVAFIVLPIASSAFLGDDQFNSTINGSLSEYGVTAAQSAWYTTLGFLHSTSRFVPGFYFQAYEMFHLVPGLAGYKAIQITLLGLDFVLFVLLLRTLGLGSALTASAVLVALTGVQFYGHYDAFLGFSATAQWWLALTLGSWLAFALWLRGAGGGNLWWRRAAVLLYLVAVLSYETCYPMSLGHAFIAMHVRGRKAWWLAWPFLALTAAALVQMVVGRVLFPQPANATYSLHLLSLGYVRTVFYQITASLPLMHLAFYRDQVFAPGTPFWSAAPWWLLASLAAVSAVAAFAAFRALGDVPVRRLVLPAALGAWLWVEAALLLAAIPRYQVEVVPGHGYGPMVLGGFGLALLLACALGALARRVPVNLRTPAAAALAAVFALVLTVSFETNEQVLRDFEGERAALINLSAALDHGVASDVPDGATLLSDSPLQIMGRYEEMRKDTHQLSNPHFFVREHSGRSVRVRGVRETPSAIACDTARCAVSDTYGLRDVPFDVRDGYTVVGRVAQVGRAADGSLQTFARHLKLYVRGDRIAALSENGGLAVAYSCGTGGGLESVPLTLDPAAILQGAAVRIEPACDADLASVQLAARARDPHS